MHKVIVFLALLPFVMGFQVVTDPVKGAPAPPFSATTMNGETISLASFRGSLVYLDFWASWCLPCRKQNVHLVKLQEKYKALGKRKGIPIVFVSISMDTNKNLWTTAVAKDNLTWKNQVCDLKGWESPLAKLYKIKKLPSSFVIDTAGQIIATDLWGPELDERLETWYGALSN